MSFSEWIAKVARDPVSGFTHLAGAVLGLIGLVYLLQLTLPSHDKRNILGAAVFGMSLIALYLSSAAYHLLQVSDSARLVLRRIDHALIFTLIAGTYTPFCLITLRETWGTPILIAIWSIALVGFGLSVFWIHAPRWLSTALYLFMGWFIVIDFGSLTRGLTEGGLYWLVAGGLSYTVGAVVYAVKRPDPFPPHFGFHEIWHLMVLGGSACHFMSVVCVLRSTRILVPHYL